MIKAAILALLLVPLGAGALRAQSAEEEAGWIAYNTDLLKARLHDPESAQFREVLFSRKAGVPVACGEADAKDESGAYSGFERFVGAGSVGIFLPGDIDDFEALWQNFCR